MTRDSKQMSKRVSKMENPSFDISVKIYLQKDEEMQVLLTATCKRISNNGF